MQEIEMGETYDGSDESRLKIVWKRMRERCSNPNRHNYHRYGGRGIGISGWESRTDFIEWALANGYRQGLYIDRIDNDAGYSPENCQFVTVTESNRNTSTVKTGWKVVRQLRSAAGDPSATYAELARAHSLSERTVRDIIQNKTWADRRYTPPPRTGAPT